MHAFQEHILTGKYGFPVLRPQPFLKTFFKHTLRFAATRLSLLTDTALKNYSPRLQPNNTAIGAVKTQFLLCGSQRSAIWLLLHVSPTYNVLGHIYIVFPDDLAKGKRFSWCCRSCSYCSCCGSCTYCGCRSCVVPVVV